MATYKLDINVGYGCNFKCKYCFEKKGDINYKNLAMPFDIVDRACLYARHVLSKLSKEDKLRICFFGGEPLLYIDVITRVIENLRDTPIAYNIITNGSLIRQKSGILYRLRDMTKNSLHFRVSYDYSLQDKNRQSGSYKLVRDNIAWLYNNGFNVATITVLPEDDLPDFYNVFYDYARLQHKVPPLRMFLNITHGSVLKAFNESATRDAFTRVQKYVSAHSFSRLPIYSAGCGYRGECFNGCVFGRVYAGIDVNGDIYPGYSIGYNDEYTKNALWLGSVTDDFDILDKYREELISTLPNDIGDTCRDCIGPCQLLPWNTIKTRLGEYNAMPDNSHCKIHKLVQEYLSND